MFTMILRIVLLVSLSGYFTPAFAQNSFEKIEQLVLKADQTDNPPDAIKLAQQAYATSEKLAYKRGMLRSLSVMAAKSMDTGNWKASLKFIDSAEVLAHELNNFSALAHLTTIKGYCFTKIGFLSEGKMTLIAAKAYAEKVPDVDEKFYRLGHIYTNLGVNYQESDSLKDSLILFNKLAYGAFKKISEKSKYKNGLGIAAHNYGATLSLFHQFDLASRFLKEAIQLGIRDKNNVVLSLGYNSLAWVYLKKKDYTQAIECFNKGRKTAIAHNNSYLVRNAYEGLWNSYAEMKKQDSATFYLNKFNLVSDSIAKAEKSSIQTSMNSIKRVDEQKQSVRMMIFILVLAVVLVFFILSFTGYLTFFKKFKKEQLDKTELECLLNEKMFLLKEQSGLPKSDAEELKYIVHLAMTNDPCFFVKFKEFDSLFIKKLLAICPKLVATELELCALLRLNFETKEIARYTRQSVRAVESKKFRIRKKLNVSSEVDLNIWMSMV